MKDKVTSDSEMSNQPHLHGDSHRKSQERKLHRDWRIWAAVILMLACMAIYVLTLDESEVPGGSPGGNPPATNAPAQP